MSKQSQQPLDVKAVRAKAELTQKRMAYLIGVSLSTWKRWERQGRFPNMPIQRAAKIAELSGVGVASLPQ